MNVTQCFLVTKAGVVHDDLPVDQLRMRRDIAAEEILNKHLSGHRHTSNLPAGCYMVRRRPHGPQLSADGAFHLELDEAAPLDGVLHGQRAGDGLDEAVHHEAHGLLLREAT